MFLDELEEVLKQVPYNVWEKVVGDTVDSVTIKRRWYPPSDEREKIIVYVRSGIITHAIEGLDTLDDREETLVRCWKPYRRLVEREVRAFNQLLEQPTEYMTASLTEKEFDRRLDDFLWPKIRIGYYAHCFGLESYMKDKCFGEVNCAKELDELFWKEAFCCTSRLVEAWIHQTMPDHDDNENVESVCKRYGIHASEEVTSELKELADYCVEAQKYDDVKSLSGVLRRFLSQNRSIKQLYEDVDQLVEEAHAECSEKEKEYSIALGIWDRMRGNTLALMHPKIFSSWAGDGCNHYARGLREGMFEAACMTLYNIYSGFDEEKARSIAYRYENPDRKESFEDLLSRISGTAEDFKKDRIKLLNDDHELFHSETSLTGGRIYYEIQVPEYGLTYGGFSKEKAEERYRNYFELDGTLYLIRKYLQL